MSQTTDESSNSNSFFLYFNSASFRNLDTYKITKSVFILRIVAAQTRPLGSVWRHHVSPWLVYASRKDYFGRIGCNNLQLLKTLFMGIVPFKTGELIYKIPEWLRFSDKLWYKSDKLINRSDQ